MKLQGLEELLVDLATQCEQLAEVLSVERQAMKAWQVDRLDELAERKQALLEAVKAADQAFKAALERTLDGAGCSAEQLFARPEAVRLKGLKGRVEAAGESVRREGELNRKVAEHVVGFLNRLRGVPEDKPLTYGPGLRGRAGNIGYGN